MTWGCEVGVGGRCCGEEEWIDARAMVRGVVLWLGGIGPGCDWSCEIGWELGGEDGGAGGRNEIPGVESGQQGFLKTCSSSLALTMTGFSGYTCL